jgi:uncharacterized protein YndB with AHSA1/START domain
MTSATAVTTQDQDAVVSELSIAAPLECVFQALIDRKQVMQWWTSDILPWTRAPAAAGVTTLRRAI